MTRTTATATTTTMTFTTTTAMKTTTMNTASKNDDEDDDEGIWTATPKAEGLAASEFGKAEAREAINSRQSDFGSRLSKKETSTTWSNLFSILTTFFRFQRSYFYFFVLMMETKIKTDFSRWGFVLMVLRWHKRWSVRLQLRKYWVNSQIKAFLFYCFIHKICIRILVRPGGYE